MYVIKISKFLQLTLFHASVSSLTMAKCHLWEVFEFIFKIIAIKPWLLFIRVFSGSNFFNCCNFLNLFY